MTVTIYHNPRCSKSRQTLALLEEQSERFHAATDPCTIKRYSSVTISSFNSN